MRVKEYPVLERAVDAGITLGWNRAHKHDAVTDDRIMHEIREAVLLTICEAFELDDTVEV
jgi:uncharacterized ferredoxin-like protein